VHEWGLDHAFERWDGKGFPHRARGEEVELTAYDALGLMQQLGALPYREPTTA
jgi:hypothetical protein